MWAGAFAQRFSPSSSCSCTAPQTVWVVQAPASVCPREAKEKVKRYQNNERNKQKRKRNKEKKKKAKPKLRIKANPSVKLY